MPDDTQDTVNEPHWSRRTFANPQAGRVVVLAASAGGIAALRTILSALPAEFPAAIIVVLHRAPTRESLLAKILARDTALRVTDAIVGDHVAAGTVYLAPVDLHAVLTAQRRLDFHDGRKIAHVRSSANPLLESAARAIGRDLIAVVLSGSGRNGSAALPEVKAHGGTVIAQDRETSQHFGMPAAAIETGAVDFVLPLDAIAPKLIELTKEH